MRIRLASPPDVPLILQLIRELAAYEREPDAVVATAEDLLRDGLGASPKFHVLLAFDGEEPAGFAFYLFTYSTWRGTRVLYLEDLFVRPEKRAMKVGVSLMRELAREAGRQGCSRFVWQVLDWNEPAIAFYEAIGARVQKQWLTMWVTGDALSQLAQADDEPAATPELGNPEDR